MKRAFKMTGIVFLLLLAPYLSAEEPPSKYVWEVFAGFKQIAYKDFGLVCTGDCSQVHEDIEYLGMRFDAKRSATLEEARVLEVLVTEKFVQTIHAHEQLRPYLREYPFPAARTEISIRFDASSGGISRVSHIGNDLIYRVADREVDRNTIVYEEPYLEALEKVRSL